MGFIIELKDILFGFKRVVTLLHKKEKISLVSATLIMLVTGFLTNIPAVILGKFLDVLIVIKNPSFSIAMPFLILIVIILVLKELLTVNRKYLVENIATQTEKKQTVKTVEHLLKTDINAFIGKYQIGALHGRIFRSIQGLIQLIKLGFLDFFPTFFAAIAALVMAFYLKPELATFMILVIPTGLQLCVKTLNFSL